MFFQLADRGFRERFCASQISFQNPLDAGERVSGDRGDFLRRASSFRQHRDRGPSGIEEEDRIELRADFGFLRKWRKASEQVERVGIGTVVTVLLTGVIGVIWLGVKTILGK